MGAEPRGVPRAQDRRRTGEVQTPRYIHCVPVLSDLRYGGHFTSKAKRLALAACLALVALVVFGVGLSLSPVAELGVTAGFLMGLGPSGLAIAAAVYRNPLDAQRAEIYSIAQEEILHERLNDLAAATGVPTLDVAAGELSMRIRQRAERIAHFAGLDEHRRHFME